MLLWRSVLAELATHVTETALPADADGILGFDLDGVTGHPDHEGAVTP